MHQVLTNIQLLSLVLLSTTTTAEAQSGPQSGAASIAIYCPNIGEVLSSRSFHEAFMKAAIRARATAGEAIVQFTVTADDKMTDITVPQATHPAFADAATVAVRQLRCSGEGRELHLRIPFAYKLESSSYAADPDDILAEDLPRVVPLIAELRTEPRRFTLKPGEGLKISNLKVLAFDVSGKFLGRLRQSDQDAQPPDALLFRNADVIQAKNPGAGHLELSAPNWSKFGGGGVRPTVRIEILVVE